jgi:peptidyl-prolyl cis-trans isomerase SurA
VIDQVVWFVGDEPVLKSDVEAVRLQMQMDGERMVGDPYCFIPEQIAVNKLYLHQAKLDSIEVPLSSVSREVERLINYRINQIGSREKLEEYAGKSISELREEWRDQMREREIVQQMQRKIVGDVKLTPADIRNYYTKLPQDSLPFIPTTVEVQIMTFEPEVSLKEKDAVKARLRDLTDRINKGESFSTLAIIYSEDTETAKRGGELGFMGRAQLVPEFTNAAFALTDPKKVSNIVETEYGYHIIQLIERRGDRANFRHILIKPKVSQAEMDLAVHRMDSIQNLIKKDSLFFDSMYRSQAFIPETKRGKAMTFDDAIGFMSYDIDTKNNKGIMVNQNQQSSNYGTPRFEMQELPAQVAIAVEKMKIGQISEPFKMLNSKGKDVVAVVKLRNRIDSHRANMTDDYVALKEIVESHKRNDVLEKWVKNKINSTNIRIVDGWQNCDFRYKGWVKKD